MLLKVYGSLTNGNQVGLHKRQILFRQATDLVYTVLNHLK
jgi:hypothetical protein